MALSIYNIRKWWLMVNGRSILHVNQDIGRYFSITELKGYYNNLTEKVTRLPQLLHTDELPTTPDEKGGQVFFPVAIFQYGLGAYDLYLASERKDDRYEGKFMQCGEWAINHQEPSGAWNNFFFRHAQHPYGAMAQGEGASLLLRAYIHTGDKRFLDSAKKAIDFMLKPLKEGGTTDGDTFMEYTHLPAVMNGWIFAWWGLYDFVLVTHDEGIYKKRLEQSCKSLEEQLPLFSNSYWSMYDLAGHIASPFYHSLHIAQMQAMYQLTGHDIFREYARKWKANEENTLSKTRAFVKKAWQKVVE
jgi:hypothetical protein